MRTTWGISLILVLSVLSGVAWAAPSAELAAALNKQCPEMSLHHTTLAGAVQTILRTTGVHFAIGIETCAWISRIGLQDFHAKAGTLRSQLGELCAAVDYVWEADREWINLFPKSVKDDPDYLMNKRQRGRVMVSPSLKVPAEKALIADIHASFAMVFMGLAHQPKIDYEKVRHNKVVLQNPTLRQILNARQTNYEVNYYTLFIRHVSNSGGRFSWSIDEDVARLIEKPPARGEEMVGPGILIDSSTVWTPDSSPKHD